MKENISLYGIDLICHFERDEGDRFDPQSGHYTVPGKWLLSDVEHMGESIYNLLDDALLYQIQENYNAKHP